MKKTISILLVVSILFLSGCSAVFSPKAGLIEISGLDEHTNFVPSALKVGDRWVLLSSVFVPEEEPEEAAVEEQTEPDTQAQESEETEEALEIEEYYEGEEPGGEYYYALNLVNAKNGKVLRSKAIKDCPLEDIFGIKIGEDGNIILYNDYDHKQVIYSENFEQLGKVKKYVSESTEERFSDNALVTDRFSKYDCFAHNYIEFYGKERIGCFAFPDEKDCLYFANAERFSPSCGDGKRVLGNMIEEDAFSTGNLRVYDFSSKLIVGDIALPDFGENKSVYYSNGMLQGDAAFVVLEEGSFEEAQTEQSSFQNHYYLWNYTVGFEAKPFEAERVTDEKLEQKNSDLCASIKNDFGIDVHLNEPNEETKNEDETYALELTAEPPALYESLVGIRAFFDLLPEGFVKEVYTGMEHIETEGFDIFLGKSIKGFPSAYANRYGEKYMLTFATDSFNSSTMAHEFMHLIDGRLDNYYWEENLDDVWGRYHPQSFEYFGYEDFEEDSWDEKEVAKYDKYFATRYGMSAATEDRADMFSSLFESGAYENQKTEAPYWYKSGKVPAKKAVLLCKMIRKAFPCMKNAPVQVWEKSIEKDIKF